MNTFDGSILGIAAFGLMVWLRGCWRNSVSDCLLGLLIGLVASSLYFFLFSLTRTAWLAAITFGIFLVTLLPFRRTLQSRWGRILVGLPLVLAAAAGVLEFKLVSAGNALLVIEPYRLGRTWVFDEPRLGLRKEPFVQGIPEMIDQLVAQVPGSEKGVRLTFSQRPFPGVHLKLDRRREENGGNWYFSPTYGKEGWLCPALFKFFPRAPKHIYVKAEAR